jgi:hypothetical protein
MKFNVFVDFVQRITRICPEHGVIECFVTEYILENPLGTVTADTEEQAFLEVQDEADMLDLPSFIKYRIRLEAV